MVPHLWIKKFMEMSGDSDNIPHVLSKSMESWKTIMSWYRELAKVNTYRGIFQGNMLILRCRAISY